MKITYNNFEPLKENEIAGAQTINPMQRYMLGIHSLSEFLDVNPDGQGSISFDLNFEALAGSIIGMLGDNGGINFDFKCSVSSNNVLTVSGGKVFLPFDVCSVSSMSTSLSSADSGKMVYVRLTSKTTGSIVLSSSVTHTLQTGNDDYRVTLPVALLTLTDGAWRVHYLHLGSFALAHTPYFYVTNYHKNKAQILGHSADENDVKWEDVDVSDSSSSDDSDSSSSSSNSSSSSSGSSSGSNSSSSGSSSSSTEAGYIECTKYNEQPEYPITFDGAYRLVSGNPTDTSGVWRHADGHEIYFDNNQGAWICHALTGYWAGHIYLTTQSSADKYNPTTWTSPHCASDLLSPAFNTSVDFCFVQTGNNSRANNVVNSVQEDDIQ